MDYFIGKFRWICNISKILEGEGAGPFASKSQNVSVSWKMDMGCHFRQCKKAIGYRSLVGNMEIHGDCDPGPPKCAAKVLLNFH